MTTEEKKEEWESFLSSEPKEGESYIVPNIEIKLSKEKRQECREIVKEIKEFGVNQRQMLYLIYLLSLELEDTTTMRAIAKVVGENRENIPIAEIEKSKTPSLIVPLPTK